MKLLLVKLKDGCQLEIVLGVESVPLPPRRQAHTWPACCFTAAEPVVSTVLVLVGHAGLSITPV